MGTIKNIYKPQK
uniref:Uncharacterized protein n=1 Tax=Rhizophora mucronata TaxID=61149 RepID=A0A2P2L4M2_RHIMU